MVWKISTSIHFLCSGLLSEFPEEFNTIQCHRVLGNSLNVHVVSILIRLLLMEPGVIWNQRTLVNAHSSIFMGSLLIRLVLVRCLMPDDSGQRYVWRFRDWWLRSACESSAEARVPWSLPLVCSGCRLSSFDGDSGHLEMSAWWFCTGSPGSRHLLCCCCCCTRRKMGSLPLVMKQTGLIFALVLFSLRIFFVVVLCNCLCWELQKGGWGYQSCYLIPRSCLLSRSSTSSCCSFCLVLFLLMVHSQILLTRYFVIDIPSYFLSIFFLLRERLFYMTFLSSHFYMEAKRDSVTFLPCLTLSLAANI